MDDLSARSAVVSLLSATPSALQRRPWSAQPRVRPAVHVDRDRDSHVDALDGRAVPGHAGLVYNEVAFQYLLSIERTRAAGAGRAFLLMLMVWDETVDPSRGRAKTAGRLLPVVRRCLRETDFVGWYRQDSVAGAVLTHECQESTERAGRAVRERILAALNVALPARACRLPLHLYEVTGGEERRIE